MIKDIRLQDFIAHKDTRLEFGKGITIFVGHNGSGKSSVIDAITFALFGEHTRKSGRNLVRRGAGQCTVQMRFAINSREYQTTRSSGGQSFSQLTLVSEAGKEVSRHLVGGERKQFGESVSLEVARVLGLDYNKMRVAAVVQQGELLRIVDAPPREFKELLNGLIGIDRLDRASAVMLEVVRGFREKLRDENDYSDLEIPRVQDLVTQKEREKTQAESMLQEFEDEKVMLEEKIARLEGEISQLEPVIQRTQELGSREKLLVRHVAEKRGSIEGEVVRLGRLVKEATGSLAALQKRDEVRMRLKALRAESEAVQKKAEENERAYGELSGLLEFSGRLQLADGKCPVCNSTVTKLNDMFDVSHLQTEIRAQEQEKFRLQRAKVELRKEEQELLEQDKKIAAAEKFLSHSSISTHNEVQRLETDLEAKKRDLGKLPQEILKVGEDPFGLAIDGISTSLAEEIVVLRQQTSGISHQKYTDAKLEKDMLSRKLQDANRKIGGYQKTLGDAEIAIDSAKKTIAQLQEAAGFARMLETIRSQIFNRDGPIGTSLRSWAIKVISEKASDYASLFNIGISRVQLAEKARDVSITCYGRQGEIDLDSLSGGEKVAVALALRLGIAFMMGSSKLDFVILDEPTTHLDEDRRKALVRIISDAFREGTGPLSQLIIITHDSDIFEDSEVDRIFRFTMTADGSKVSQEG